MECLLYVALIIGENLGRYNRSTVGFPCTFDMFSRISAIDHRDLSASALALNWKRHFSSWCSLRKQNWLFDPFKSMLNSLNCRFGHKPKTSREFFAVFPARAATSLLIVFTIVHLNTKVITVECKKRLHSKWGVNEDVICTIRRYKSLPRLRTKRKCTISPSWPLALSFHFLSHCRRCAVSSEPR